MFSSRAVPGSDTTTTSLSGPGGSFRNGVLVYVPDTSTLSNSVVLEPHHWVVSAWVTVLKWPHLPDAVQNPIQL